MTGVANRLLGTVVSLIGATSNTTCGTINSVNSNFDIYTGNSESEQTYTVSCPATTEKTNAVLLSDNVMEEPHDKGQNWVIMNIAEVMIYKVTGKFFYCISLDTNYLIEIIFNSFLFSCRLCCQCYCKDCVSIQRLGTQQSSRWLYFKCIPF